VPLKKRVRVRALGDDVQEQLIAMGVDDTNQLHAEWIKNQAIVAPI
jgi:hypothetical protein